MLTDQEFLSRGYVKDQPTSLGCEFWTKGNAKNYIYIADENDQNRVPEIGKDTLITLYSADGLHGFDEPMIAVVVKTTHHATNDRQTFDAVLASIEARMTL